MQSLRSHKGSPPVDSGKTRCSFFPRELSPPLCCSSKAGRTALHPVQFESAQDPPWGKGMLALLPQSQLKTPLCAPWIWACLKARPKWPPNGHIPVPPPPQASMPPGPPLLCQPGSDSAEVVQRGLGSAPLGQTTLGIGPRAPSGLGP